jgi:effector-binding domain-containing protein
MEFVYVVVREYADEYSLSNHEIMGTYSEVKEAWESKGKFESDEKDCTIFYDVVVSRKLS